MRRFASILAGLVIVGLGRAALPQNPDFPGYIGVYVVEGNGGMQITSFIPDTPAAEFAARGEIRRGDIITRIGRYNTPSIQDLRYARNSIPLDSEAKMILRDPQGFRRYVWISRNEQTAAAAAPAGSRSYGAPGNMRSAGPPDRFSPGGQGVGNAGEEYRRREGAKSSDGGKSGDGGEYRPRQ